MANDFMNWRIRTSFRLLGTPQRKNSAVTREKGTANPFGISGCFVLPASFASVDKGTSIDSSISTNVDVNAQFGHHGCLGRHRLVGYLAGRSVGHVKMVRAMPGHELVAGD